MALSKRIHQSPRVPLTKGENANPIAFVAISPKDLMNIQLTLPFLDGIILIWRLYNAEYVDQDAVYLIQYAHDRLYMMTSSNGNIFRVTGSLCGEFTGRRWIPPHKGQWRGALMFSLICAWINACVNNRETGDLRRHRAHYDVIVTTKHNKAQNLKHT